MITLPVATSGSKISNTATDASSADVATGLAAGSGTSTDAVQSDSSQAFLALLGNKLLSLARQSETTGQTTAANTAADDAETASLPKAKLNALLAALDKPETLTALLKTDGDKPDVKNADTSADESQNPVAALNGSDMQALQALFAMLPPPVVQTAVSSKSADSLASEGEGKKGQQTTLASLLATGGSAADAADSVSEKTSKLTTNNTLSAASSSASQKLSANTSDLNTAFQQALSQHGTNSDKENSSSVANATITNNVISAATTTMMPATNAMVTAPATPQLNAQLGSDEWQQALGQQILMFSRNGQQTAELRLHPQDLGSIQISLKLDNDQAQLSMASSHGQVRAALEAAIPQLRSALAESGISLGQSNVSSDAFQQGQNFNDQQGQQRNNGGDTFSLDTENDSDITPIAVPAALQARAGGSSAVDIFA